MNIFRRLSLLAVLPLVTACAFHYTVPGTWGDVPSVADDRCPDISGRYANAGVEGEQYKDHDRKQQQETAPSYLAEFFFSAKELGGKKEKGDAVFIRQADGGAILLTLWEGGKLLASRELKKGTKNSNSNELNEPVAEYFCEAGWLKVVAPMMNGSVNNAAAVIGAGSITNGFVVSREHLLQKREADGVVLVLPLPIPLPLAGTVWFRYPRLGDVPLATGVEPVNPGRP